MMASTHSVDGEANTPCMMSPRSRSSWPLTATSAHG